MKNLKFIDLFAGIGGFHLALKSLGMKCVFTSEIDEFARKTYASNFNEKYLSDPNLFAGDIWKVLKKYRIEQSPQKKVKWYNGNFYRIVWDYIGSSRIKIAEN